MYKRQYYNNGEALFEFKCTRQQKNLKAEFSSPSNGLSAVNGSFKFLDIEGTLIEEHLYSKGYPKLLRTYS